MTAFSLSPLGYSCHLSSLCLASRSTDHFSTLTCRGWVTQLPFPPSSFCLDSETGGIDKRGWEEKGLVRLLPWLHPLGPWLHSASGETYVSLPLRAQGGACLLPPTLGASPSLASLQPISRSSRPPGYAVSFTLGPWLITLD